MSFNPATAWAEIIGWSRPPQEFSEPEQLLSAFFTASNVGLSIVRYAPELSGDQQVSSAMNGFPVEAHLGSHAAYFGKLPWTLWSPFCVRFYLRASP